MTSEEELMQKEYEFGREIAINEYTKITGRKYVPDDMFVVLRMCDLRNTEYQQAWHDLESYKRDRCKYDIETNEYLVWLVTDCLQKNDIHPIYLDQLPDGTYALVDGMHRLTARFISEKVFVRAYLNKEG